MALYGQISNAADNDGSLRSNLEAWAEFTIRARNTAWLATQAANYVGFRRIDAYRGGTRPKESPDLTKLFVGQEPFCSVAAWGSTLDKTASEPIDWLIELHCLIGVSIGSATGAQARQGNANKIGLNRAIQLVAEAIADQSVEEAIYNDETGTPTGNYQSIGDDARVWKCCKVSQRANERTIGHLGGYVATDLIFTVPAFKT